MIMKMLNILNILRKKARQILLIVALMFMVAGHAGNEPNKVLISGQILHVTYGGPIAGHMVAISYTSGDIERAQYYYNEVFTDAEGYYYDTILTNNLSGKVVVTTFDKNQKPYENAHHFRFIENLLSNVVLSNFYIDAPYQFKPLQARFKYVQKAYGDRYRYWFFDQTTNANIVARHWDFGDGNQSSLQNPEHIYTESGLFKVTLTVTAQVYSHQFTNTISQLIYISPADFYHFGGHLFSEYMPVDLGSVYLYSVDTNQHYKPVDTAYIDTLGYYYFYQIPTGNYVVKGEVNRNSMYFDQLLPTYFGNSLYWQQAQVIHLDHTSWEYDIHLHTRESLNAGTGIIEGKIEYDNLPRGMDIGQPASNVSILLMDENGSILSCAKSNNEGRFGFNEVEATTYWIYPEITGVTAEKIEVPLTAETPHVDGIHITIVDDVAIGINDREGSFLQEISFYPNPVSSFLQISSPELSQNNLSVKLFDTMGKLVYSNVSPELVDQKITLDVSNYPSGVYLLHVMHQGKSQGHKVFICH